MTILCTIWTIILQQNNQVNSFTCSSSICHSYHESRRAFGIPALEALSTITQQLPKRQKSRPSIFKAILFSSFTAEGSEYAAGDSDFDNDDDYDDSNAAALLRRNDDEEQQQDDEDDENRFVPTVELQPVPISKNAGNRFVTVIWDRTIKNRQYFTSSNEMNNDDDDDWKQWNDHYDRIRYTEDHVLFCRKQNLYNTTFNNHSMVDILWSLPM